MKASGTGGAVSVQTSRASGDGESAGPGDGVSIASSGAWMARALTHVNLDDESLQRGVPTSKMLRQLGVVLSTQPGGKHDYHDWSMEVKKLGIFISHSWTTPRWSKLLVLLLHFNLWPAMIISSLVSAVCCWLVVRGTIPHVVAEGRDGDGLEPQSMACTPAGMATFWLALFALHELDRCCSTLLKRCSPTVFLDKICISQSDLERKEKAIQNLAAFLANSDNMLVCYSDLYLRRLWTIYEVATWLIVRQGKRMIVRPCSVPQVLLCGQFLFCVFIAAEFTMVANGMLPSVLISWVSGIPLLIVWSWMVGRWAEDQDRMKEVVENFSLAKAKCAVEEDRHIIRNNIVAFMRYAKLSPAGAEDEAVVEAFEDLVHKKVPQLLRASFGAVGMPYAWTLVPIFPQLLYMIDIVANSIMQDHSPRLFAISVISQGMFAAAWAPLIIVMGMKVMRCRKMRGFLGCVVSGVALRSLTVGYILLSSQLRTFAMESDLGLAVVVAIWAIMIAIVVALYCQ